MADNIEYNRGFGKWLFAIYQPSSQIGPFCGYLIVNKDYHIVTTDTKDGKTICVISVPSPNVSYVINELIKSEREKTSVV